MTLRNLLRELAEGFAYVRDPHAFEARMRRAEQARHLPRPSMFELPGVGIVVHPALESILLLPRRTSDDPGEARDYALFGVRVYVSEFAVKQPPAGGWPDVVIPARPRLRP